MKQITRDMLYEFNAIMQYEGSVIRLYESTTQAIDIKLIDDKYLKMQDQIVNPSREFYNTLQDFFKDKGITISFNNTWSCFWATHEIKM